MGHENPLESFRVRRETYDRNYRGVVQTSSDPTGKGRVKVMVLPMFRGIPVVDLPWAVAKWPLNKFDVPQPGATVWVFFEEGNIYQPVYDGYGLPITNLGPGVGTLAGVTAGDPAFMLAQADAAWTTLLGTPGGVPDQRRVTVTPGGVVIEVQDIGPGSAKVMVFHPLGAGVTIDETGKVVVTSPTRVDVNAPLVTLAGPVGAVHPVVTTQTHPIDSFTGAPIVGTTKVLAGGP